MFLIVKIFSRAALVEKDDEAKFMFLCCFKIRLWIHYEFTQVIKYPILAHTAILFFGVLLSKLSHMNWKVKKNLRLLPRSSFFPILCYIVAGIKTHLFILDPTSTTGHVIADITRRSVTQLNTKNWIVLWANPVRLTIAPQLTISN